MGQCGRREDRVACGAFCRAFLAYHSKLCDPVVAHCVGLIVFVPAAFMCAFGRSGLALDVVLWSTAVASSVWGVLLILASVEVLCSGGGPTNE